MEELNIDDILSADEIDNLYQEDETEEIAKEDINSDTTEEETSESVGSEEENHKEREDKSSNEESSQNKFYSSIAKALSEDGVFPDLSDEIINNINNAEDFRNLIVQQINAELSETQQRIQNALNVGMEGSEISKFENVINYLNTIKESDIVDETEEGEKLRKTLIYNDLINKGYSKERATREVQKSFSAATDIEDAKDALESSKHFFKNQYDNIIENLKKEQDNIISERKKFADSLKESLIGKDSGKAFGDIEIDKKTSQRVYENITKPIYRDPESGNYYTAIQKYEMDNPVDFLKNVGLAYTLTDGFKNIDKLVKGKVKKELNKGLKDLERTISTSGYSKGNLKFVSGVSESSDTPFDNGWDIDI